MSVKCPFLQFKQMSSTRSRWEFRWCGQRSSGTVAVEAWVSSQGSQLSHGIVMSMVYARFQITWPFVSSSGFLRDFVFTQGLESTKVHLPNEFPRLTTRWRPQQKEQESPCAERFNSTSTSPASECVFCWNLLFSVCSVCVLLFSICVYCLCQKKTTGHQLFVKNSMVYARFQITWPFVSSSGFLRDFVFTQGLESTKVHLPNEFPRLTTRWRPQQKEQESPCAERFNSTSTSPASECVFCWNLLFSVCSVCVLLFSICVYCLCQKKTTGHQLFVKNSMVYARFQITWPFVSSSGFLRDFVFTQGLESTKVHLPNEFPRLTTRWRPQQKEQESPCAERFNSTSTSPASECVFCWNLLFSVCSVCVLLFSICVYCLCQKKTTGHQLFVKNSMVYARFQITWPFVSSSGLESTKVHLPNEFPRLTTRWRPQQKEQESPCAERFNSTSTSPASECVFCWNLLFSVCSVCVLLFSICVYCLCQKKTTGHQLFVKNSMVYARFQITWQFVSSSGFLRDFVFTQGLESTKVHLPNEFPRLTTRWRPQQKEQESPCAERFNSTSTSPASECVFCWNLLFSVCSVCVLLFSICVYCLCQKKTTGHQLFVKNSMVYARFQITWPFVSSSGFLRDFVFTQGLESTKVHLPNEFPRLTTRWRPQQKEQESPCAERFNSTSTSPASECVFCWNLLFSVCSVCVLLFSICVYCLCQKKTTVSVGSGAENRHVEAGDEVCYASLDMPSTQQQRQRNERAQSSDFSIYSNVRTSRM
nr:uncharacterized protein LOC103911105 isoform X5 [Danio rerio]|eukprot:XP_017211793.1 uncharacterized protein LOC103911105 isoform X5 [Danio rerio]